MTLRITAPDGGMVDVMPGDSVDYGREGLVVFYSGAEADAVRSQMEAQRKKVRDDIEESFLDSVTAEACQ